MNGTELTETWNDDSYKKDGLSAQRRWPNEEFCRFMGRNFFGIPFENRKSIKILEVGCGTGANLRLLIQEGFSAYGIDLSEEAVKLAPKLLAEVCPDTVTLRNREVGGGGRKRRYDKPLQF